MKQVAGLWLPDADTYFGPILEREGGYHIDHLEAALRHVPADRRRLCVEAGAHIGIWTQLLVTEFDHVIAVEPARDTYVALLRNMAHATNVYAVNGALGRSEGRCVMVDDPSARRLGNTGARYAVPTTDVPRNTEIPMMTLDRIDVTALSGGVLDFIKIDVEGAELDVLLGGEATIRATHPVIIIEDKPGMAGRFGGHDGDAQRLLRSWGARMVEQIGNDYIYSWA